MFKLSLIFLLSLILFSCNSKKEETNPQPTEQVSKEVNVYTHRHYETDKELFAKFEQETGIKVNVIKADANELIARIEQEGANSPADLLLTVDAGNLWAAKNKGVSSAVESEILNKNIPAHLRDPENHWFGLTKRARIMVYSKDRFKPKKIMNYSDLADPIYKGKVLVRPSDNIYNQSLLASIVSHEGSEKAGQWVKGVVNNLARKPSGNDRDQIKAIALGEGDISIVNTYYIAKMITSDDELEREAVSKISILFPNQDNRGAHINISGGIVLKTAPNRENAIKLLEFLSAKEAQELFADANFEYPVNPEVQPKGLLLEWGPFKEDTLNLSELGKNNLEAVKLFDINGWN